MCLDKPISWTRDIVQVGNLHKTLHVVFFWDQMYIVHVKLAYFLNILRLQCGVMYRILTYVHFYSWCLLFPHAKNDQCFLHQLMIGMFGNVQEFIKNQFLVRFQNYITELFAGWPFYKIDNFCPDLSKNMSTSGLSSFSLYIYTIMEKKE